MNSIYKPIAMFKYDNKKYCIVVINNSINFFKYENGKVVPAHSKEELELFLKVHNAIKIDPNNNHPLRIENIAGKDFEIYYDVNTRLYFGYRIKDGKRFNPNEEECALLNFKYNNLRDNVAGLFNNVADLFKGKKKHGKAEGGDFIKFFDWAKDDPIREKYFDEKKMYEENRKKFHETRKDLKKEDTVKFFTFSGLVTLALLLNAGTAFIQYSSLPLAKDLRKALDDRGVFVSYEYKMPEDKDELLTMLKNQEYHSDMLNEAMDKNIHLNEDEKDLIRKFKFVFDENSCYMNTDQIKSKLETLRITYSEQKLEGSDLLGMYSRPTNEIIFYGVRDFNDVDVNVFAHELMHVFQLGKSDRFTMELSNELFTRECLRRLDEHGLLSKSDVFQDCIGKNTMYGSGYDTCMLVEYILADVLTQQQLKAYQFTTRDDLLINYLADIEAGDKGCTEEQYREYQQNAVELLDAIEALRIRNGGVENDKMDFTSAKYKEIIKRLEPYYVKKHGITIEESMGADLMNFDTRYIKENAYSNWEYDALFMTLRSHFKKGTSKESERSYQYLVDTYDVKAHVLPKTFFSFDHKKPTLILDTGNITEIEVDQELAEKYRETYRSCVEKMTNIEFSDGR
ncbi:MAG: hypothetical protein IKE01_01715 [Clostridia bacterium]|nr:hypothetical protein [Clostridia bacterium]